MYNNFTVPLSYSTPFSYNHVGTGIIKINGIESAKQFSVPPNDSCALFDSNENVFYIKSVDGSGFANLRKFRYTEEPTNFNQNDYVTRDEYNKLLEVIKNGNVSVSNTVE